MQKKTRAERASYGNDAIRLPNITADTSKVVFISAPEDALQSYVKPL